jgi:hypothetical protein
MYKKIFLGVCLAFGLYSPVQADPVPGDIFKEFVYLKKTDFFKGPFSHLDSVTTVLQIGDLDKAGKAEIAFYYWGGHSGTSGQEFRVNGGKKYRITQPVGTPGNPECYYRTVAGRSAVGFPLTDLKEGSNTFAFYCGNQICHGFNWPHYWIYKYIVRIYYEAGKPCQKGRIIRPVKGEVIGDFPDLELAADHPDSVSGVDFIAYYGGYDIDGDGIFSDWQYQVKDTEWSLTAGHATQPRFKAVWDNYWIPDQVNPIRLMAKITDKNGYSYMTEPEDNIRLVRKDRSVSMYLPHVVPEVFGVRKEQRKECTIPFPDDGSGQISDARLCVSTWSANVDDDSPFHEIGINRQVIANKFGKLHDHSLDLLPVPTGILRPENVVHIYSSFTGHALEINWPGPALLVERCKRADCFHDRCRIDIRPGSDPVVDIGNDVFRATIRSHKGATCGLEHAIRDWTINNRNVNQAVFLIDACAQRGPLKQASILFETRDSAGVKLEYQDCKTGLVHAVSEYKVYRNSPFIRIGYLKYPEGWWNTVDIGRPGGERQGVYKIFGMEDYSRDIALYPGSYWNTHDRGYETDPKDGGVLSYKGHLIMLVGDLKSGTGFGRVMPVKTESSGGIKILKLLNRRGFETFPATGDRGKPYSSAVFVFDQGLDQATDMAKEYIDNLEIR